MAAQHNSRLPILAVDLGGTKVAAALVTPAGAVQHRVQAATSQRGPESGIAQIIELLSHVLDAAGRSPQAVAAIGIGAPAVLEEQTDRVLWAPNLAGWRDVNVHGPLLAHFGRPVCLEYDGHTATLAEWWLGAGRNLHSFVNVIIGTGIGGGMVLEGRLIRGVNRLAGAAGWFILGDQAPVRDRERRLGFWEGKAAGPGIVLRAQALLADLPEIPPWAQAAAPLTPDRIFAAAEAGDALATTVLAETTGWIGRGLANIVSLVNPQAIVLGGGVGAACAPLLSQIRQEMEQWAQPLSAQTCALHVTQLGADAGLLGAAYGARLRLNS